MMLNILVAPKSVVNSYTYPEVNYSDLTANEFGTPITFGICTMKTLADRIVFLRNHRGLKPVELARKSGIKQPSLWAIENGKTLKLKSDTLFRMAAALEANPDWIRTGRGDPFEMSDPGPDAEAMSLYATLPQNKKAAILAMMRAITDD